MDKLIAVIGPTAVGKTAVSVGIAEELGCEIVSCDSMQLYRFMDIGSAKPSPEELSRVRHHLVGEINPDERFSVAIYRDLASEAIRDIISRGITPLIVGGTGLYLDSILYDLDFSAEPSPDGIRDELYAYAEKEGPEALYNVLSSEDAEAALRIHPNNTKRVVRAIEAARAGRGIADFSDVKTKGRRFDATLIGLFRDRAELYGRIDRRVDNIIECGLEDEVRRLMDMGLDEDDISMKGIGYKEMTAYIKGVLTLTEAADLIKKNTRHYAKRQETWFRRYDDCVRFDITGMDDSEALRGVLQWLKKRL